MRLISAQDYRRAPWKNGGGETAEIAIWPSGSGIDNFDWRVSRAIVAASGPFSPFPEIDRTLAILTGAGMTLEIEGMAPIRQTPDSPPLPFPGDRACVATLLTGVITDLNIMTRRGRYRHAVTLGTGPGRLEWRKSGGFGIIHAGFGPLLCRAAGETRALASGDTVIIDLPLSGTLEIDAETRWLGMTITPAGVV